MPNFHARPARAETLGRRIGRLALVALAAFALTYVGCSSDSASEATPATTLDAGDSAVPTDTPEPTGVDCTGKADGEDCGDGNICLAAVCSPSKCGDGFVNAAAGEQCEDGNDTAGDGCTACRFDCSTDTDCDDKNDCTTDTCAKTDGKGTCSHALATAGAACKQADGADGICKESTCVAAGCGNGVKDAGEECDDGNTDDNDGCTAACKLTCKSDADCDDGDKCTGTATCDKSDPAKPVCKAGTPVSCAKKGSCGADGTCDPATGACTYADADKDGVTCDTDCNDADPATYPGAAECKDGKDNDCNGKKEDSVDCVCYLDPDKDGYAAVGAATIVASPCPTGYTNRKPADAKSIDCRENNAYVNPAQTKYFATSYCTGAGAFCGAKSFDYNCSGADNKRWGLVTKAPACTKVAVGTGFLCSGFGWVGVEMAPACGTKGNYRECTYNATTGSCVGTTAERTQECR